MISFPTTYEEALQEEQEQANEHLRRWDASTVGRVAWVALSMCWISLNGIPLLPIGLLIGLPVLLPRVSGWTFRDRFRSAGKRAWLLVGACLASLLLLHVQIGMNVSDAGTLALFFGLGRS